MRIASCLALILLSSASVGCGKRQAKAPSHPTVSHVAGTPSTGQVISAWQAAGLAPAGFVAAQPAPYLATYCEGGRLRGIDTMVCEYADDAALEHGIRQLKGEWDQLDVATGVSARNKRTLLIMVDRAKSDPNGKSTNQAIGAFKKL